MSSESLLSVFETRPWIPALLVAAGVLILLLLLRALVVSRLRRMSERTETIVDDVVVELLAKVGRWFMVIVSLQAGASLLELDPNLALVAHRVFVLALIVQGVLLMNYGIVMWLERQREARSLEDPGTVTTLAGLSYVVRLIVWSAALLLALDNFGVDVTALIAGLGVGGIAIALAVQNVLGDLFASLSIALDKPFVIGDFIIVDDLMGTVEKIGLKTTRVRSLSGEQLIFSNSDLLSSRIRNYKRMQERRVAFKVGVTYQTRVELLKRIPQMARECIENAPQTRFDRAHFKEFGDSALVFEFVYYVGSADYAVFMDTQQQINLDLCTRFEELGIEFAYPTQTLHLVSQGASG